MSKILDLAKKLKALADRGVGGERENATNMLLRYMDKHGISINDIEDSDLELRTFKISPNQKTIFIQVAAMVLNFNYDLWKSRSNRNTYLIECTPGQQIEIQVAFDFYWNAYKEEIQVFTNAFIQKNRLFRDTTDEEAAKESELSKEEALKLIAMMEGIEKRDLKKQING